MELKNPKDVGSEKHSAALPSGWIRAKTELLNDKFNSLSIAARRRITISFGIGTATIVIMLIVQALNSDQHSIPAAETITLPQDIYQENEMKHNNANTLAPIGKMKGEIDGKFEAFYLAIDNEGTLFINRDPPYGEDRFLKTNGWQAIPNEQFREYEKELHFIPHSRKDSHHSSNCAHL